MAYNRSISKGPLTLADPSSSLNSPLILPLPTVVMTMLLLGLPTMTFIVFVWITRLVSWSPV